MLNKQSIFINMLYYYNQAGAIPPFSTEVSRQHPVFLFFHRKSQAITDNH